MKPTRSSLAGIIVVLLLTACGGKPPVATQPPTQPPATQPPLSPSVPAPQEVTITIWHQWSDEHLNAMAGIIAGYMTTHPEVTITLSRPDDTTAALAVAIPFGEGPDIIAWTNDQIGTNALKGNIVALDEYSITHDILNSTYEPVAVAGVTWQDKTWAIPESLETITLVYNKAIASQSDFPVNPMDFDDLLAKAKAFYETRGIPLFCNQGFSGGDAIHITPVFFGFGVPNYIDDQGGVTLNTQEAVATGKWLTEIKPYLPDKMSYDICKADFIEGKVAAWWTGPWAIPDLDNASIEYGFAAMGKPFVSIRGLMLTKNAVDRGNADVALDIMNYLTSYETQTALALSDKITIPANTAALKNSTVQALAAIAGFVANANLGIPMIASQFAGNLDPVGDATAAIWTGNQTPEEALAAAQVAIETAIAGIK